MSYFKICKGLKNVIEDGGKVNAGDVTCKIANNVIKIVKKCVFFYLGNIKYF